MTEKQGMVAKAKQRFARARERHRFLDHVVLMVQHYGKVEGNVLAGAVTYFGFLSFFPILALAFAVIGYVSVAVPDARDSLTTAIEQLFPGIVSRSGKPGTISLKQIEDAKAAVGIIGFVGVLYSGLGWLSGLRTALTDAFQIPRDKKQNFILGKATDLVVLAILGVVLVLSVGISGVVKGLADNIINALGLEGVAIGTPLIWVIGIALSLAASTLLLYVMFRLLAHPDLPSRPLWEGGLLGATGFELLKLLVLYVLGGVGGSAFAPLAIAITLVVWINYFSRLVLYGASWAMTSRHSHDVLERRTDRSEAAVVAADKEAERAGVLVGAGTERDTEPGGFRGRFDPGSAVIGLAGGALAAFLLRRGD